MTKIDVGLAVQRRIRRELRERGEHALIERQQAPVDRDADQGRGDALGDRRDVVFLLSQVRVEVCVQNQNAAPSDLHAIDWQALCVDLLDDVGKRGRVGFRSNVRNGLRTPAKRGMPKHLAKFPASSKHLQHLCVELA